jgi:hypothetical protein
MHTHANPIRWAALAKTLNWRRAGFGDCESAEGDEKQ